MGTLEPDRRRILNLIGEDFVYPNRVSVRSAKSLNSLPVILG